MPVGPVDYVYLQKLRDKYAKVALKQLMIPVSGQFSKLTPVELSEKAYKIADEMMKRREMKSE